jgi:hypothetical protein
VGHGAASRSRSYYDRGRARGGLVL